MNRVAAIGVVWALVWGAAWGQGTGTPANGKRPMTFADLMAMKRVSDPQVSPSGKWVLFSVTGVSLEKNSKVNHLWVVPLNPTRDDKAVTNGVPGEKQIPYGNDNKEGSAGAERQVTFGAGETFGRFSPDGKWVSMTIGDHVYLAPWDEAAGKVGEPKQLTRVSGGGEDGAIWSPDSKRLMFTAQVYPECSIKGGDEALKKLEPADGRAIVGGSLKVAAWKGLEPASFAEEDACDKAKDEAADKNPVKATVFDGLLYRHWDHWTGEKRSHIFVLDADGTHVRDLTPANEVGDSETPTFFVGGAQDYAWAPDSKEIAYVTNLDSVPAASTNNDVFTLRLDEPGAKAVKVSTSPGSDDEPEYSPDGKWLAFRSQARGGFESDRFDLVVMDRSNGRIDHVLPRMTDVKGEPVNDNWVDEFTWASDSKTIAVAAPDRGREIVQVNPLPVRGSLTPAGAWTADGGELGSLSFTKDGKIVATQMYVNRPTEIVVITHKRSGAVGGDVFFNNIGVRALTGLNDVLLSQLDMSKLESFWFVGAQNSYADNTQVEGFLLKPPNFDPAKKYPVKFLMHGGPQTAWGDAWSYRWNWELMAASGYVVIGINRRGSTGYGQKFADQVSGDWGGRAYEDLMKGLDYAEAHYSFIDKDRECALGASYGGFMANWVLTHTNRFKCIVTHDGVYDPVAAWGATEEMWFNEWEFRRPEDFPKGWDGFTPDAKQTAAGHPAEPWRYENLPADQDPFRRWSPMRFIANAKTPTLVIHSQKDMRLDVSQGFELFTALQMLGVPSKFLYFPDEGHWVLKPKNSELWNEVVSDWCDKWTRSGKYAEAGSRE